MKKSAPTVSSAVTPRVAQGLDAGLLVDLQVMAVWMPLIVVPRSLATVAIETFMTDCPAS